MKENWYNYHPTKTLTEEEKEIKAIKKALKDFDKENLNKILNSCSDKKYAVVYSIKKKVYLKYATRLKDNITQALNKNVVIFVADKVFTDTLQELIKGKK